MPDKIYHFVPPQDPENGIGEVDRAIADRYGNIIDETYFTSEIAYTKEEVDALIEAAQVGVQWGKITGTLSDQTDLQAALDAKQDVLSFDDSPTSGSLNPVTSDGIFIANQLLREVAEGKCKSFTTSYQLTLSEMQTLAQQGDLTIYDGQGTNVTDSIIDGSHMVFIDGFLNPSLNSQASSIGILTEYVAVGDPLSGNIILDTHSGLNLKTGDIIIVIETDVPDRWYASNNDSLYILETAKIDLSTYITTNTAQNIFAQKTIMYPYVFLMQSNWTNYFMQLSASEQGALNVAVKPAIGNATIRYKLGGNAFTPESGSISLGSSSKKWTDVFMSGVLSDGNSSYGLALPDTTSFTANKTIATTDDITNMMTTDTEQTVSAAKLFQGNNLLRVSAIGWVNAWFFNYNAQRKLELKEGSYQSGTPTTHYIFGRNDGFYPATSGGKDLGMSSYKWKDLYLSGKISDGNSAYGLSLPDMTSFTENKTIATTDDINNMFTTDTEQTITARKNVGLTDDQRYKGYIKPITAGMEIGMLDDDGTNQYENPRIKISGYAFQVNTLQPINTSTDIGTESSKFRNIYLNENANFSHASTQVVWAVRQNQYGNLELARNNAGLYSFASSGLFPNSNNQRDLGASALRWRNAYISGDIQKVDETIEFICPQAATLGLTLTTVAMRATILNKMLNITIAFKLANPTSTAVSLGNTFEGFIKLDQNVFARIKDMNGNTLSAIASSTSDRSPIIGKGSYQHDNAYPTEGWIYLNSLSIVHWHLEDNINTTRFHIGFRSGPSIPANKDVNFIANIEIPLDL